MQSVMGIDLGTQSIKVIIYDSVERSVLDVVSHPLELISKPDGTREQIADWWLEGVRSCLDKVDPALKSTVAAIGVSGQQHGFVPVAADGSVLAPVKLWCDTATQDECTDIMEAFGGTQATVALAGNAIAVGYTASKILWLKRHKPDAYARMRTIMLPHDYLNFWLTGVRAMECGDASGTGLLDVRRRRWCPELVAALDTDRDLMSCLPGLVPASSSIGTLRPEIARELGLPASAIVSAGGGDNMMAAIGTGTVRDGRLTASLGTSGTLFGYTSKPAIDPDGDLAAFCASTGGWLPLLCTMNCTVATEQMRALLKMDVATMDVRAARVPIGANGVITLPFYNGERTPALPNGKAVIAGLDPDNCTDAHLMRSAMESAILGLRTGLQAFARCGMSFDAVTLTGGGSASAPWRQITADILNLPVRVLKQQENAAFGAALQALWCLNHQTGGETDIGVLVDTHLVADHNKSATPDAAAVAAYDVVYQSYTRHVAAITPLYR